MGGERGREGSDVLLHPSEGRTVTNMTKDNRPVCCRVSDEGVNDLIPL